MPKPIRYIMIILALSLPSVVNAAWVRDKGQFFASVGGSYTSANTTYDANGAKQPIPRYTEFATQFFAEYGVTDKLTLGYGLPVLFNSSSEDATLMQTQKQNSGAGDSLFASRYQFYSGAVLLSAGLDLGLPTGQKNADLPTGDGEFNFIPKLYAAGGGNAGVGWFYLASAGFNKRTLNFSDEVQGSIMFGAALGSFIPMASLEIRHSLRNGDSGPIVASPLFLNNPRFLSWSIGTAFKASEKLIINAFFKGAIYAQNILGAASVSVGVGYIF